MKPVINNALYLVFLLPCIGYNTILNGQESIMKIKEMQDDATINALLQQAEQISMHFPDSAIMLSRRALTISRQLKNNKAIARSLIAVGASMLNGQGQYKKSRTVFLEAVPYCRLAAAEHPILMPQIYNNLGIAYFMESQYDSAFHYYYKALEEIHDHNLTDTSLLMLIYANMGGNFISINQNDQGLYYLRKVTQLWIRQRKNNPNMAAVYYSTANAFHNKGNIDSAMKYWTYTLQLYREQENISGVQRVYCAIGTVYLLNKDIDKAIIYYDSSAAVDQVAARNNLSLQQGFGGVSYYKGDYEKAIAYYKRSLELCEEQGARGKRIFAYWALADMYNKTGNNDLAYEYQRKHSLLMGNLMNEEKMKTINLMEVKYRTSEKDKELALNKVQLYRQRLWITGIALGGLLLSSIAFGLYRGTHQKHMLQSAQIRNLEQQRKLEHLHAKMQGEEEERSRIARELHDGVNVLLSATKMNYAALGKEYKGLPETSSYAEVMGLLNEIGLELRTITYKLVPELLIQQSLPDAVETFCELIRKGNNLYIEFQSWGSFTALPSEYCFATYRIVQELVHNIIKHAHATGVLIQLRYQDSLLCLTIEDNGAGFDPHIPGKGLGLQSVHRRVKDLNGEVIFNSRPGEGTSVEVEFFIKNS